MRDTGMPGCIDSTTHPSQPASAWWLKTPLTAPPRARGNPTVSGDYSGTVEALLPEHYTKPLQSEDMPERASCRDLKEAPPGIGPCRRRQTIGADGQNVSNRQDRKSAGRAPEGGGQSAGEDSEARRSGAGERPPPLSRRRAQPCRSREHMVRLGASLGKSSTLTPMRR
jgi:hypothetical protein